MDFFLKLSEIGQSSVLGFFDRAIEFFNTPVNIMLKYKDITVTNPPALSYSPIPFVRVWDTITNLIASIKTSITGSNVGSSGTVSAALGALLEGLGFNVYCPLWEFMLVNLGLILSLLIIYKLLAFMPFS